jgi:catechol 2,3-dioxygenase-like lactoylglutathione lyase family enzyme
VLQAPKLREEENMATHIATGGVHHLRLTVTDVARSREFYTSLLGFQVVGEFPPVVFLSNGSLVLVLGPAPERPVSGDRFDPNRVGLDHLSFSVANRDALDQAMRLFDERGVSYGAIGDYPNFRIYVLPFRDPDNMQLEFTAPYSES